MVLLPNPGTYQPEKGVKGDTKESELPRGYMEEFASFVAISPGEEILFSMPVNHLSKRWHVEIPFDFQLPHGKGPLPSNTVGLPVMRVHYAVSDLPKNSQAEILNK